MMLDYTNSSDGPLLVINSHGCVEDCIFDTITPLGDDFKPFSSYKTIEIDNVDYNTCEGSV